MIFLFFTIYILAFVNIDSLESKWLIPKKRKRFGNTSFDQYMPWSSYHLERENVAFSLQEYAFSITN